MATSNVDLPEMAPEAVMEIALKLHALQSQADVEWLQGQDLNGVFFDEMLLRLTHRGSHWLRLIEKLTDFQSDFSKVSQNAWPTEEEFKDGCCEFILKILPEETPV